MLMRRTLTSAWIETVNVYVSKFDYLSHSHECVD